MPRADGTERCTRIATTARVTDSQVAVHVFNLCAQHAQKYDILLDQARAVATQGVFQK